MPSDNPRPPGRRRPRDDEPTPAARLISAAEARRIEPRTIRVPDGENMALSPSDPAHAPSFARVSITSFQDLQLLGLAPRGLAEDKLREAIAADDVEAYRLASAMAQAAPTQSACDCDGPGERSANPVRSALARFRARHNPHVGRLLSELYGRPVGFDSPLGAMIRKMTDRLTVTRVEFEVIHLADIHIGVNATLTVPASTQSMAARHIYIEDSGTLRLQGGYTKIWASSIGRFRVKLDAAVLAKNDQMRPIWLAD